MLVQHRICVIGMWHIGLPLATILAGTEDTVCGIDIDTGRHTISKRYSNNSKKKLKDFKKTLLNWKADTVSW